MALKSQIPYLSWDLSRFFQKYPPGSAQTIAVGESRWPTKDCKKNNPLQLARQGALSIGENGLAGDF